YYKIKKNIFIKMINYKKMNKFDAELIEISPGSIDIDGVCLGQGAYGKIFIFGNKAIKTTNTKCEDEEDDVIASDVHIEISILTMMNHPYIIKPLRIIKDEDKNLMGMVMDRYKYNLSQLIENG